MLMHLRIILAETDKMAESKLKFTSMHVGRVSQRKAYLFAVSICLCFERPVEVAQMKTTHLLRVVVTKK